MCVPYVLTICLNQQINEVKKKIHGPTFYAMAT